MTDLFTRQWGFIDWFCIGVITILGLTLLFGIPYQIDRLEKEDIQREAIPEMPCKELGEFILGDEIMFNLKPLADKHWHIRCG